MKLRVRNGQVEPVSFFKFVFVGHTLCLTTLFLPIFLVVGLLSGYFETEHETAFPAWATPLMIPVIAAGQGLLGGGLTTLGLWIWTRRGKIVVDEQ